LARIRIKLEKKFVKKREKEKNTVIVSELLAFNMLNDKQGKLIKKSIIKTNRD